MHNLVACQAACGRLIALLLKRARHLKYPVRVIGDGTESVHRQNVAGGGEQSQPRERDSIEREHRTAELAGREDKQRREQRQRNREDRPHARLQPVGEALNNQRGGTCRGGGGDFFDRLLLGGGEVFGNALNQHRHHNPERGRHPEAPPVHNRAAQIRLQRHILHEEVRDAQIAQRRQNRRDPEAAVNRLHRVEVGAVFALDRLHANNGRQNAHAAHQQGEHHQFHRAFRGQHNAGSHAENNRSDEGHFVRLEHIGSHPGAVADIIAHIVGNRGGVARVVFGDASLHLAHEVGAHIGAFGVDTTAHTHKQRRE